MTTAPGAASGPPKIALPHVIAVVIRDGHSTQDELAQINPIAVEYQAAFKAGTQNEVAKPLLARLMVVVGKERLRSALAHLKTVAESQANNARAPPTLVSTTAQAGSEPGPSSACGQKHGLEPSASPSAAQPNAKRARADEASALVAAAPPTPPEGTATRAGQKRARAADAAVDSGGGLLADVNLDDEQARLLAPRPAHATRSRQLPPAAPAAAAAEESAGARGARLARWLGGTLAADGLGPADGPAHIAELVELLDGALRQRMRQLLCGVCDASQRRRETAASEAGLVRNNAPQPPPGGGTALVPAGGGDSALVGTASRLTGAASVTLRERVQIRDALHFLESERRSSKSPVLAWWRAVGSARSRFPRHLLSAWPAEREVGGSGAGGDVLPTGDPDDAGVPTPAAAT